MSITEKQIFCADANMCAIIAKRNSQNKWELWGLSNVLEIGEAKYETRLFKDDEYDAIEPINTTSGHTHIKVLKDNIWSEIVFIENKKAANKPIEPNWRTCFSNPPLLELSFDYEDEKESIESLVERGAGQNQTVLIDQINTAEFHYWQGRNKRLLAVIDYFLKNGIDVNTKDEWGQTALMLACRYLNIDVVKLLLANGANINSECCLEIFAQWDTSVNEIEIQIQIELFKLLWSNNIDVNIRNSKGKTALMYIVQYSDNHEPVLLFEKQMELLKLILDKGADVNLRDNEGKTALMYAVESKKYAIEEYLLQQGAKDKRKRKIK